MIQRFINLALLLIAVAGFIATYRARAELRTARAEHDSLAAQYGTLDVEDPGKFYVVRLATNDPMHFAWRFYYPDNLAIETRTSTVSGSSSRATHWSGPADEEIVRVRFRYDDWNLLVFTQRSAGSSTFGIGDRAMAEFLKKHWDELQFGVIGEGETVAAKPDRVLKFLSIRIPESLARSANEEFGRQVFQLPPRPLIDFRVGTADAFKSAQQTGAP